MERWERKMLRTMYVVKFIPKMFGKEEQSIIFKFLFDELKTTSYSFITG